jgi:hypothetical protein
MCIAGIAELVRVIIGHVGVREWISKLIDHWLWVPRQHHTLERSTRTISDNMIHSYTLQSWMIEQTS